MPAKCDQKNPLKRSGTYQDARLPEALSPESFKVDERSLADLVLFARRLSRHLKYYTGENVVEGDWLPFFASDITATLAGLSKIPVAAFLSFNSGLQSYLIDAPLPSETDLENHFKLMFHLPLMLLKDVGMHYTKISGEHAIKSYIWQLAERDLEAPIRELISFYKGAVPLLFEDTPLSRGDYNTTFQGDDRIQLPASVAERIDEAAALSTLAIEPDLISGFAPSGWSVFYNSIIADPSPYEGSSNAFERVDDALSYNLLVNALGRIYQAVQRIAEEADSYFTASLTEFAEHTPHYGLWLAFLQLFRNNQDQLNTLTGTHLDYYYKDILQLCLKPADPDQVQLLFELARNVDDHLLKKGTLFKAGRDSAGQEVVYQLDEDFVVNRASIGALKAIYIDQRNIDGTDSLLPYASPVVNSRDGKGEELPADAPQWRPFGPFAGVADAEIGFVVADRQLFLREGGRAVTLTVKLSSPLARPPSANAFKAALTGAEGWFEIEPGPKFRVDSTAPSNLTFSITLDGEDPPIVPYDAEIHNGSYDADLPLLKILFHFKNKVTAAASPFTDLKDINFEDMLLQVEVSSARNFTLQNEFGVIDTSKPFLPFGPTPKRNASLILGSNELFSKKLDRITLDLSWAEAYSSVDFFLKTSPDDYKLSFQHLKGGAWQGKGSDYFLQLFGPAYARELYQASVRPVSEPATIAKQEVASLAFQPETPVERAETLAIAKTHAPQANSITLSDLGSLSYGLAQTMDNPTYTNTSSSGFILLVLDKSFGHEKFINEKTLALIDIAKTSSHTANSDYNYDANDLPLDPYAPQINQIELSYTSAAATPSALFHVYPFGHQEVPTDSGRLFPDLPYQGELYLGIRDLNPPQRLTLLFQCAEGTANPLKGEGAILWHYLKGNEWIGFKEQDVDDKTDNLSGSGIVGVAVPEDADTEHDLLPSGLHWLRLAVVSDADALNSLFTIDTQAASATFLDQGNAADFLETPLASGTISKLKISDASIKKIEQPAESFGGKPQESDDHFHVRVSERLRHKDRAVTMWDYEHLILEAFPEIYKVRCINHTELCRDLGNNIVADNELKPGHVLVVTIPYITEASAVDPLRPYTRKKTLVAMDAFLRQRMSPFVNLEVQNPKVEEVQVKFDVAFNANIADISFYKEELNLAIRRYLTPWTYTEGAEISFGGKWHKSAIINFVEEQPYVDYLKNFEMYHRVDIEIENWSKIDEEVVEATTSRSILVSHKSHIINEIV
jgi:hypothetical protein